MYKHLKKSETTPTTLTPNEACIGLITWKFSFDRKEMSLLIGEDISF